MFGISMWELGLIFVVALIVLGPRQLMEAAKVVGRLYREVVRMAEDVRRSIDLDLSSSTTSGSSYTGKPSTTHHAADPAPAPASSQEQTTSPEPIKAIAEKTGPDFYADLLEQSERGDIKQEQSSESSSLNDQTALKMKPDKGDDQLKASDLKQ